MASGSVISSFDTLPEEALRAIMLALPVDDRARAACVRRSWRALLADPSLWQVLNLTRTGGVAAERVTENLVRGAVARAAGSLRFLRLGGEADWPDSAASLVELIESDGAELQHHSSYYWLTVAQLQHVLAAAPRMQTLTAAVDGQCKELLFVLRNDPPFGPLRVTNLRFFCDAEATAADMLAFAAAVAAHQSLTRLTVSWAYSGRETLYALIDAAASWRVVSLMLDRCTLDADSVTALARLLKLSSLTHLGFFFFVFLDAQEACMLELYAALRECHTLTDLTLSFDSFAYDVANRQPVAELLDAAAALPALAWLEVNWTDAQHAYAAAYGRAIGALLAANPPSLRTLIVEDCVLGDEGMAPLLDGLAANTHLRTLECQRNSLSEAFKRDRLLPALAALAARANPGA
jgi:hypothetical protein